MARTDWAALVTEPAQEYQIRTELERFGLHPYLPQLRRRHHAGHHAFVLRHYPLFPRYLLLPFNQALDPRIRLITHIHRTSAHPNGVLVTPDGQPWRCPAYAIQEIREAEIYGRFDEVMIKGTVVTFTAPHLASLHATLTRIINPSTVAVFTPLFGGSKAIVKSAKLGHKQQSSPLHPSNGRPPVKYQGKDVQILRNANKSDDDYDEDVKDQVVIRTADGKEKTVPRAEVTDDTTVNPTPPQKPV